MKKLRIIIIDDEPSAIDRLVGMLKRYEKVQVIGTFTEASKAIELAKEADLILLDIEMPNINGLEFAKQVRTNAEIIFTTAFEKYALESYKLGVMSYLLKPVSELELTQAIERVYKIKFSQSFSPTAEDKIVNAAFEMVAVKTLTHTYLIKHSEILYGRAYDGKVILKTLNGNIISNIIVNESFEGLLGRLTNPIFIKTHKSYFVNKLFVDRIDRSRIYLRGCKDPSDIVKVSRDQEDNVHDQLGVNTAKQKSSSK
jgi:DNA-binding LytR/AlgR family response regulator